MGFVIEVRHPHDGSGYYVPFYGDGWGVGGRQDAYRFRSRAEAEAEARKLQQDDPERKCRVVIA